MSCSEIAQSIYESTQGKVTHRQGDFNWKLGSEAVRKLTITLFTATIYIEGRRRNPSSLQGSVKAPASKRSLNHLLLSMLQCVPFLQIANRKYSQ